MALGHRILLTLGTTAALRPMVLGAVLALNIVHPLIHGTVLDGGAVDTLLANVDMLAAPIAQG